MGIYVFLLYIKLQVTSYLLIMYNLTHTSIALLGPVKTNTKTKLFNAPKEALYMFILTF